MRELIPFASVHVVGVGGAGMSGLAKLLAQAGHRVTGSDLKPGPLLASLAGTGIETWLGHRPQVIDGVDLVVASSAVPDSDPELQSARRAGVEVWQRPQLLEAITARLHTVGVTGTHGKTTCSAMLVTALRAIGLDPSFMVGGQLIDLNTNAHLGEDDLFALEADEAFGTFMLLDLSGLLVTNIEADHLDHYRTVDAMEGAYAEVAARVDGPVVACVDDPGVARLRERVDGIVGYGTAAEADWRAASIESGGHGVTVEVVGPEGEEVTLRIPKPGRHVGLDGLGVLALAASLGHDPREVAAGLAEFHGVRRRFEIRARRGGVTIVDDYAHHPTEVAATLEAARRGHDGRVIAVFQPHRYSRTRQHGEALGRALGAADVVFVSDVYAAGEAPIPGVTGRIVADAAGAADEVRYVPRRADLAEALAPIVGDGDLVLLLGAGDITQVADELAPLLPEA